MAIGLQWFSKKKEIDVNWEKVFSLIFEFSVLAVVFGVPLFFAYFFPTNNIFELNKTFWFRFWLLIAIMAWSGRAFCVLRKHQSISFPNIFVRKYFWLFLGLFIAWVLASCLWGVDRYSAFFGAYFRQEGALSWFSYAIWSVLLVDYFTYPVPVIARRRRFLLTVLLSSSLAALYAILQYFNLDFLDWTEPANITKRSFSTFGQPNILASFLLISLPLSFYFFKISRSWLGRSFSVLVALVQFGALLSSGSRGAWIALFVSFAFVVILSIFKKKIWHTFRFWLISGVAISAILVLVLLVFPTVPRRFAEVFDFNTGSSAQRVNIYQAAAKAIINRPFVGYGADNQQEILVYYYQKDWAVFENVNAVPDRAHNLFLDLALSFGLVGLALIIFWLYQYFILIRKLPDDEQERYLFLSLFFAIGSYLFSLFFNFSSTATQVYFFALVALSYSLAIPERKTKAVSQVFVKSPVLIFAVLMIIGFCLFGLQRSVRSLEADHYFQAFYQNWHRGNYFTALVLTDYLNNSGGSVHQLNSLMVDLVATDYSSLKELTTKNFAQAFLQKTGRQLKGASFFDRLALAKAEAALGDFQSAEKDFAAVSERAPEWPNLYYYWGKANLERGDSQRAIFLLHQALNKLPEDFDNRLTSEHRKRLFIFKSQIFFSLAAMSEETQNYSLALNYYRFTYAYDDNNLVALKKMALLFFQEGRLPEAKQVLERALFFLPNDIELKNLDTKL